MLTYLLARVSFPSNDGENLHILTSGGTEDLLPKFPADPDEEMMIVKTMIINGDGVLIAE